MKKKKLSIQKFQISKLDSLRSIKGGSYDTCGTDGEPMSDIINSLISGCGNNFDH